MVGGKPLVGGTAYRIVKGRSLIGGTGYDIPLDNNMADFLDLMAHASYSLSAGRNASSTGSVYLSAPGQSGSYPYWVLTICDGEFSWTKFTNASTKTVIYQSSASKANCAYGWAWYYSDDGTSSTNVYGATMFACTFSGYTEAEVDAILSGISKKAGVGRNAATVDEVSLAVSPSDTVLVSFVPSSSQYKFAISSPIGTVIFGDYTSNPSLLYVSNNVAKLSVNGTSSRTVYGGSIITLQ